MYRIEIIDKSGEKEKKVYDNVTAIIAGFSCMDDEGGFVHCDGTVIDTATALCHAQDMIEQQLDRKPEIKKMFMAGQAFKQFMEAKKDD